VTIECIISQKYHRTVMGSKGHKVQEITRDHEVGIKFPDRPTENQESEFVCHEICSSTMCYSNRALSHQEICVQEVVPQIFTS
jgi:predicted PilT family ATPase